MKKFFAALMVVAGLLAVSCGKDGKEGGSIKDPDNNIDPATLPATLKGSNYFPIILDEESGNAIASKIVCDLRPDDATKHLYIWSSGETYAAGEGAGTNFYGKLGYLDLVVTNNGWSGAGFNVGAGAANLDKFADIAAHPDQYYFHVAYKGKAGDCTLCHVYGLDGSDFAFAVGDGVVNIDNVDHTPVAPKDGAFEAGEWLEYEFSVQEMGLNFGGAFPAGGVNIFTFLSGGTEGREVCLDAAFFYKK